VVEYLRAKKIKGTTLLVALTFAFVIPFLLFIVNMGYTQKAKPQREFSTDYIMRYGTGGVSYLCGLINFLIYFALMNDFREFLKKRLLSRNSEIRQPDVVTGEIRAYRPPMERREVNEVEDHAIELMQFRTFHRMQQLRTYKGYKGDRGLVAVPGHGLYMANVAVRL